MALTTTPKPGAMADSARNISARFATKERFRGLKEKILQSPPAYKVRKPGPATPRPPQKLVMKKAKGGMVRGAGCAVRGKTGATEY